MPPKGRPKRPKPYDSGQKTTRKSFVETDPDVTHPDIIIPMGSNSVIDNQQPGTSSSQDQTVSRYEFLQFQKSMNDMFKSIMASVQKDNSTDQSKIIDDSHLLCPPTSVVLNQPSGLSGRSSPAILLSHSGRASPVVAVNQSVTPTPMVIDNSVVTDQPLSSIPLPGTPIGSKSHVPGTPRASPNLQMPGTPSVRSQIENDAMSQAPSINIPMTVPVISNNPVASPVIPIRFPPTSAEDAVQSAVNYHLSSIVNPGESFNKAKVSYQVDRRIPDKILQLIWEDQYVDLTMMIPKDLDPEAPLQLIQGKPGEPATWAPVKSTKFIENIAQWSDLFDTFVAAYSRKFPDQTPNLLTHKFNVTQLASDGADYLFYDVEFRKAHSKYGIPWENPDMQLWVKAANKGIQSSLALAIGSHSSSSSFSSSNTSNVSHNVKSSNQSFRPSKGFGSGAGNKLRHPAGYCFHFHNKRCGKTNCRFLHQCWMPGCGERHSVYKCPKLQNQSTKFNKSSNSPGVKQPSTSNANKL